MEEDKAAAYYEELTRKGEGAARFKQGLGFSSSKSSSSSSQTLPSSTSSFLSSFIKASSPEKSYSQIQKQSQLHNIQNKLKKKEQPKPSDKPRVFDTRRRSRSRSRSRDRNDSRHGRGRDRDVGRSRRKSRSRSRSYSDEERRRWRRRSRERRSERRRSRSLSPRREKNDRYNHHNHRSKEKNGDVDYSTLIKGYDDMTAAGRVKAKMKLQLSQTVEKDTLKGMGAGWERFEFNKDAPLDDEEVEVAEDDAALVKNIGQSFRFSAVKARREEQIKAAHDEAIFGAPTTQASILAHTEPIFEDNSKEDNDNEEANENELSSNLVSTQVLAKQQGSWRDRARKIQDGSKN